MASSLKDSPSAYKRESAPSTSSTLLSDGLEIAFLFYVHLPYCIHKREPVYATGHTNGVLEPL
jgi:hypothetical protein